MAEYEWNIKQAAKAGILEYIPGESAFTIKDPSKLNDRQKAGLTQIQSVLTKMKSSGVQQCINAAVFELLKMKPIFPGGLSKLEDSQGRCLPDCFLMPEKTTALDFAFRLHTDFGKTFIQAIDVKRRIAIGKDYVLQPGDIVEIKAGK
jgi:ribosome-binding ATPase YchF (GTP1/OBG family)